MRDIAKEASTSVSRLYMTFESKQALMVAIQEWSNARVLEGYFVPALQVDGAPWDRVMAIAEAYIRFYMEERELATLMATTQIDADSTDPATQALVKMHREQFDTVSALLTEIVAETGSDLKPAHVLRWCWAGVVGLASINIRLPHMAVDDDELDQIVGTGLRFVRAGLFEDAQRRTAAR